MKRNIVLVFAAAAFALICIQTLSGFGISDRTGDTAIVVSSTNRQRIRLGIDAERLWHWHSNIKYKLANLAVGEMKSDFVRVGINGAYEREKGVKNEAAYDQIIEVMSAMKKMNPGIHFFASPRPIHEAYSKAEKIEIWQHPDNVPFSPFPLWIQEWNKTQKTKKMKDGTLVKKWDKGRFNVDAWVQYYADYLNLMRRKGFDITFMDVTNEQSIVSPEDTKYMYDNLPERLNKGVKMPQLIAPSSWSPLGATNWLRSVDRSKGQDKAFSIAASHNTGKPGVLVDFVHEAKILGKEAWNTELHGWVGTELKDEILNSAVFWKHMRAGYTGIDTWLFYGPLGGRNHTMINSDGHEIKRSGKYEIFKQIVNNANLGYYVGISKPFENMETAAFVKGNILSVWVLNESAERRKSVRFEVQGREGIERKINVVKWSDDLPASGRASAMESTGVTQFVSDIDAESLYFFKLKIGRTQLQN